MQSDEIPPIARRSAIRRDQLGLSQHEVARRVGVRPQNISKLEAGGIRKPRFILALAQALETTPEWLYGDDPAESPPPPRHHSSAPLDRDRLKAAIVQGRRVLEAARLTLTPEQEADTIIRLYDSLGSDDLPPE